jgi:hypothetical protein
MNGCSGAVLQLWAQDHGFLAHLGAACSSDRRNVDSLHMEHAVASVAQHLDHGLGGMAVKHDVMLGATMPSLLPVAATPTRPQFVSNPTCANPNFHTRPSVIQLQHVICITPHHIGCRVTTKALAPCHSSHSLYCTQTAGTAE